MFLGDQVGRGTVQGHLSIIIDTVADHFHVANPEENRLPSSHQSGCIHSSTGLKTGLADPKIWDSRGLQTSSGSFDLGLDDPLSS